MQAIIIYYPDKDAKEQDATEGGIYTDISIEDVINEISENQGAAPEVLTRDFILNEMIVCYIPMTVSGRTYQERKNDIRNKAIEWSNNQGEYAAWSYGELADIGSFFETNGRRYGLLTEFRENAIC